MSNSDKLSLFFSNEFPFNKDGLAEFVGSFEVKKFKKGDIVLKNESIESELRFIDHGIIREYYAHGNKEKNINFYIETGFITDFSSFINNTNTNKYQECLSEVQLRILPKSKFVEFTNQYNCGKLFIDTIFKRIVALKEAEEFNNFINTAEELYLDIMQNKPTWLLNIPQYHLASYLGLTPETLSRIRKRI